MSSYYATDALSLRPLFGTSHRPLPADALIRRFGPVAADPQFYVTALGDLEPCTPAGLSEYLASGHLRAFVREAAKDEDADPVLFLSTIVGIPIAFRWSPQGFDEQAFPEDVLVLADAVFHANPRCQRVLTTLFAPPPPMAEESLNQWGFERVGRPSDKLGTKTWGIARDVAAMVLSSVTH